MKISNLLLFLCSLILLIQCDSPHFHQEQYGLKNNWDKADPAKFHFEIKDTADHYDFYLLSRNNNEYPYSNLYLFTQLKSPNGEVYTDTLQYYLAFQDGEWIGSGGSLKELFLMYRENVSIQDTGRYELSVWHGMREDQLVGIEDLSLIMDKSDRK